VREIITGIGILAHRRQRHSWVRSRVGGDAMDLALLGTVFFLQNRRNPNRLFATSGAVAGIALLDWLCAEWVSRSAPAVREAEEPLTVEGSIIINKAPHEVYGFWRNLENLPHFMKHVREVRVEQNNRSHWTVELPGGTFLEWDAKITEDVPNERIAWRSLPGSELENSGVVLFEPAPGKRGTLVRVEMNYPAPLGKPRGFLRRVIGKGPEQHLHNDLLRLRQWLETGELARTEGQPAGRRRSTSRRYDDLVRI
jgi:uncharacterized membrane protein